jgi:uncharacterized protein (DUF697 family)
MHDTDRTLAEYGGGNVFEADSFEYTGELEHDGQEFEAEFEHDGQIAGEAGVFSEADEMELASELLEITSEAELDQFLGKLIRRAAGAVRSIARSPLGRQLGGVLKGVARKALPIAGSALGGFFGGPAGAAIGGRLASGAGSLFGLELESMSQEDREFETARGFVRFAGDTVRRAASARGMPPAVAARHAVVHAARRHAPGLLRSGGVTVVNGNGQARQSGRWVRVAPNRVLLYGI